MKPGDVLETGVWMDGRETPEMRQQFEADLSSALAEIPAVMGPLMLTEMNVGDERVPPLPKDLSGPNVRFLAASSTVFAVYPPDEGLFIADLEPKDLERLVAITRRVYKTWNPGKPELSLDRCYESINQQGPEAALAALREQVGVKVH